jgi:hypothetical protein
MATSILQRTPIELKTSTSPQNKSLIKLQKMWSDIHNECKHSFEFSDMFKIRILKHVMNDDIKIAIVAYEPVVKCKLFTKEFLIKSVYDLEQAEKQAITKAIKYIKINY